MIHFKQIGADLGAITPPYVLQPHAIMRYLVGGGIYAPLNIFSHPICRYKATLTLFLAPYIHL
jgi:hypothetical protein